MKSYKLISPLIVAFVCLTHPALASEATLFVLDASGSMGTLTLAQRIEHHGKNFSSTKPASRFEVARDELLQKAKAAEASGSPIGLIAFGHTTTSPCNDIEVLVPTGPRRLQQIKEQSESLTPHSSTPLAEALKRAAQNLRQTGFFTGKVVIMTDGMETCQGDPVRTARDLRANGITTDVIGINVKGPVAEQLREIAGAGGGSFQQMQMGEATASLRIDPELQPKEINFAKSENFPKTATSLFDKPKLPEVGQKTEPERKPAAARDAEQSPPPPQIAQVPLL